MVPHYSTIVVEADNEDEAQRLALAEAWDTVPDYEKIDIEGSGPLQVFEVFKDRST
jgi:hypothetical protein